MGRSTIIIHNQLKQFTYFQIKAKYSFYRSSSPLDFFEFILRVVDDSANTACPLSQGKTNEISTDCLPMHLLLPGVFCVCYFFGFQKER